MTTQRRNLIGVLVLAVALVLVGYWLGARGPASSNGQGQPGQRAQTSTSIPYDSLPKQAKQTIALIDENGPYPYRQDNGVFSNREGVLPKESKAYYREYTVVTPGSTDRGARRIIAGHDGTLYYTSDHYRTFRTVQR